MTNIANKYVSVEAALSAFSGRDKCKLTSRGASAIYVALKVIGELKGFGDVIVPSIGCLSIPQSVYLAGHTPVFADVDPLTGCLSVEDISKRAGKNTKAILPIHIFGHAAKMSQICELAERLDAAVIEDACHALGGLADGKTIGSWGMFSVASFGGTKSLGGLGGGALLFDDESLVPLVEDALAQLPLWPARSVVDLLALSHRNLYHGVVDYRRATGIQAVPLSIGGTAEQYRPLLISGDLVEPDALKAIEEGIKSAQMNNEKRLDAARYYDRALASTPCQRVPMQSLEEAGTLWRYTFTCPSPSATQSLTASLRKAGLHASNQFWSLAEICDNNDNLEAARWFEERVVNIWVDSSITIDYLDRTRDVIAAWNAQL